MKKACRCCEGWTLISDGVEEFECPWCDGTGVDEDDVGYRLCYVANNAAWFADCPVEMVWGDDWDDAPYQHNAGTPYDRRKGVGTPVRYVKLMYDPDMANVATPADMGWTYSVEAINRGDSAWLVGGGRRMLHAGAAPAAFVEFMKTCGATVYIPAPAISRDPLVVSLIGDGS